MSRMHAYGLLLFALSFCGGAKTADAPKDEWQGVQRETKIEHEPCEATGARTALTQKASDPVVGEFFVTHISENGKEVCQSVDLDGDKIADMYLYFADDHRLRRKEATYSHSSEIQEITLYEIDAATHKNQIKEIMRDTNFDKRLDMWDFYEGGKLATRERDKTGDGRIDEWWTFEPPGSDSIEIVEADQHTGKPDPNQSYRLDPGGARTFVAAPVASASASASASSKGANQ